MNELNLYAESISSERSELQDAIEYRNTKLQFLQNELADLNRHTMEAYSDIDSLKVTVKERENQINSLKNEIELLLKQSQVSHEALMKMKNDADIRDGRLEILLNEIDSLEKKRKESDSTIKELFKQKWETLNFLCDQYFDLGDSESTRFMILKNIENELVKLKSHKTLVEVENAVNEYMENIVERLRSQCAFLKEEDVLFLTLIYAGYSVRAVCLMTNIKYRNFYLKKSRLSRRILDSEATDRSLFVDLLKN